MKNYNQKLKYNLQIFAEPGEVEQPAVDEPTPAPAPSPSDNENPEPILSVEEQMAKMQADLKRYKAATDKATSEAADYKRKLREKMSETEKLNEEKIEREAQRQQEFDSLKREVAVSKMSKSFMALGYSEKQANEAAVCQLDNDFDGLVVIQKEVQSAREKEVVANYMKNQPAPPSGNGSDKSKDAFLEGFKG